MDNSEFRATGLEVVRRIEQSGRFWITTTLLKGRWWFRINPR